MSAPAWCGQSGMSASEETSLSQMRQRLRRDINCLSDQDRMTRRRALTKLQQIFFKETETAPEPVLRGFFTRYLAEVLVGMLADPVEKCREMAGGLLMAFVTAIDDVPTESAALAKQVFAMAEKRIGEVPLVEPAEEVRALLLRLCCAVLARNSAETFGNELGEEACAVLSAALTDPFPESKRECCSLLLRLAAVCPGQLRSRLGKVLRPLIVNLGHQHSKTRQMTLQALGALLLCGSDDLDKLLRDMILPLLHNLLFDRTLAVRRELAGVLAALIETGIRHDPETAGFQHPSGVLHNGVAGATMASTGNKATAYLEPFLSELVSLLMSLLADDSETVSGEARILLDRVGESWGKFNVAEVETKRRRQRQRQQRQQQQQQDTSPTPLPSPPPPPASGGSSSPTAATSGAGGDGAADAELAATPAAQAFCTSLLPKMMPAAIEAAAHWTLRGRRRAVWLLCFLVRYTGDDVTPYLPQLLSSLGEASRDDETEVRDAVDECAAAVGYEVEELSAVTDVLLPVLRGEVSGQSTPEYLTQALAVLRSVIVAAAGSARRGALVPLMRPICAGLSGSAVLSADPSSDGELWVAGMEACRAVVEAGIGEELRRPEIRLNLLRALLWLVAGCQATTTSAISVETDGREGEAMEIAALLAKENACEDSQELFSRHFTDLLASVAGRRKVAQVGGSGEAPGESGGGATADGGLSKMFAANDWAKGSPRRSGFEALLRSAPRAVGRHLGEVMPIFRGLLHDASSEPELRLSMLALLECVLKQEEVTEEALRPYAEMMLKEIVVPNAVWRAGMVAATVRKVAIAAVYTALRGKKIGVEAVYSSAEQVLPILKTNLEDHEATTRQMACLSLEMMFLMMPGALGEEPVRLIYPELLKRLDDSNDTVRRVVCGAISAFFRATAPQNLRGTVLTYSVEQLLVHMDDQDESMQQAVLEVTKVAASIDAEAVVKLATAARSSHRSPEYCDCLVAFARNCAT